jgi:hypothetical protein
MLFLALFALCLAFPHAHGWSSWALLVAFVLVMAELLRDLRPDAPVANGDECLPEVVIVSDSGEVYPVTDLWPQQELLQTVDEIEAL